MKFKLSKQLVNGKYCVIPSVSEFTSEDQIKARKHGIPSIKLKRFDGREISASISNMEGVQPFQFFTQQDADVYSEDIKRQLQNIKEKWENIKDEWSAEEEI